MIIKRRGEIVIFTLGVLAFMTLPLIAKHLGLSFNDTNSVPTGLYRTVSADKFQYVAVCLPQQTVQVATRAGIAIPGGDCHDGHQPILKRLYYASNQHPIELSERGFRVDGRALANTAPKEKSSKGRSLNHFAFGLYTQGLWVISDYNANSFDSRYFGPIQPEEILYYAAPVWVF
jgi:conjugative transfer signal peptidase TraF